MNVSQIFNIQQETIERIRVMLKATPLTFGNISIDYIYRSRDAKEVDANYCEIFFTNIGATHGANCREDNLIGKIDVYSTNEIMTAKLAYTLAERLDNAVVKVGIYMMNAECVDEVVELDKNKYVQRITFKMVL